MRKGFGIWLGLMLVVSGWTKAQLFSEDFGTVFTTISTVKWPTACRVGGSSYNTSTGGCAAAGDYEYYLSGFGNYITTQGIAIPGSGYELTFDYAFNYGFSFPTVEIRTGATCGTTLQQTVTLSNTSGACQSETVNLDAYAGQTIYIRFKSNTSSASFYFDDVIVDVGSGGGGGGCLLDEDFGTAFTTISTTDWPTGCRVNSPSSYNTSAGGCYSAGDYNYGMTGFGTYITSKALAIPATGYTLDFNYSFNYSFSFPSVEIRTGASCGTSLQQTVSLTNTSGACVPVSVNLDAYAGQTIYLRFKSNTSSAYVYYDDIKVCGGAAAPKYKWADNFNDNDLLLDYTGNDGDEDCATCGSWVLGGGASLNLVPSAGWNGNSNKTEAFPDNMSNVYYVKLDRNEYIESPVLDLSSFESVKISFYAKSSSPGTGGGDNWSSSDRLKLQIWDGSSWITVQSMRDDLVSGWGGTDDYISAALPFNYYCFSAYKSASSPGNYYYSSSPNVNSAYFHAGFKFRVIFEGGFSGAPFAWVDDFTFRADADGYSTMIPCGLSFWNQPAATSYGQDAGTSGNTNAEKGVELELDGSINIPPQWSTEADDGDQVNQNFGVNESERVVFCVMSEQEINFAFPKVHFYSPTMGWQSSVMSIDNNYNGPGWRYYAVEYISCDLAGGSISDPTSDYRYYFSFEYGNEFMPVFYQLNTSGIEFGGGVTSFAETFDAPDVTSDDNCGLLPMDEIVLQAARGPDGVDLHWNTLRETEGDRFFVERSLDGLSWARMGEMAGSGLPEYLFTDLHASAASQHYRIVQRNLQGGELISNVVEVGPDPNATLILNVLPNPSEGAARLRLELPPEPAGAMQRPGLVRVTVSDLSGRTLLEHSLAPVNLIHEWELPENLASGVYMIRAVQGATQESVIWVKK